MIHKFVLEALFFKQKVVIYIEEEGLVEKGREGSS
jgi:hypothetical protein